MPKPQRKNSSPTIKSLDRVCYTLDLANREEELKMSWKPEVSLEFCTACFNSSLSNGACQEKVLCVRIPDACAYPEESSYLCEACLGKALLQVKKERLARFLVKKALGGNDHV